jgi:hypothetical protein
MSKITKPSSRQAQLDRCTDAEPSVNTQPKVAVKHKEDFENDVCMCVKDSYKHMILSTKASIFGNVLQDKGFVNGMLFKESITIKGKRFKAILPLKTDVYDKTKK